MFTIDPDISTARTLHADFYLEDTNFTDVKAKVFRNCSHYLGHQEQLKDYNCVPVKLLPDFLDDPLLLVRDKDEQVRCMSNVCTHRGNIIANEPSNLKRLSCGYHGRCFNLDGTFRSMPGFELATDFPDKKDHLPIVPASSVGPMVFGHLGDQIQFNKTMSEVIHRMPQFDFNALIHSPGDDQTFELNAHWALYVENYLEGFHVPFVHEKLGQSLQLETYHYELYEMANLQVGYAKDGENHFNLAQNHENDKEPVFGYYWWLFPNVMLNCYPWGLSLNVIEPVNKEKTRIRYETYFFDLNDRQKYLDTHITETEMEDEEIVLQVQKGIQSSMYTNGRYSPQHERGVHHFHQLLVEKLNENGA